MLTSGELEHGLVGLLAAAKVIPSAWEVRLGNESYQISSRGRR